MHNIKTRSVLGALAITILGLPFLLGTAHAQKTADVAIGGKPVKVFVPAGYVNVESDAPALYSYMKKFTSDDNIVLAAFATPAEVRNAAAGGSALPYIPDYVIISTPKLSAQRTLSSSEFGQMKQIIGSSLEDMVRRAKVDIDAHMAAKSKEVTGDPNMVKLAPGQVEVLQKATFDQNSLFFTLRIDVITQVTNPPSTRSVVESIAGVLANGKAVFINVYNRGDIPASVTAAQALARQIAHKTLEAN